MARKIYNTYSCPINTDTFHQLDDKIKYCASCQKQVHDLSQSDADEISNILNQHQGEICAIVDKRQLSNAKLNQVSLLIALSISGTASVASTTVAENIDLQTTTHVLQDTTKQFIQVKGKIKDKSNGELLPFVTIAVLDINGKLINTATTDLDGNYLINVDSKYKYEPLVFRCTYVGYSPLEIRNIKLSEIIEKISKVEISANLEAKETFITVGLLIYEKPFVKDDTRPSERTYTRDEYLRMPK
jgi:hypothetical protein